MPEPHPALEACVIVPAKNEASALNASLEALTRQVDQNGHPLHRERWEVLLLINNSNDDSFALAKRFHQARPGFPLHVAECSFPPAEAHIGHVRKVLMDAAYERLSKSAHAASLILSTDADTEVAPDWVAQNWAAARQGADAVGGRIALQFRDICMLDGQTRDIQHLNDEYNLLVARLEDWCDPQAHDRWPRHHQHFGGSLAVRPEVYRAVGGLPPRKSLEDLAFYEALVRQDVPFRHSPDVCVHTSGRLQGRTEIGLAEQLTRWSQGAPTVVVPSVKLLETLFLIRKRVRTAWQRAQAGERLNPTAVWRLASDCGASVHEMEEALACRWFGTAFESLQVRQKLEDGLMPPTEIRQPLPGAVQQLKARFCPKLQAHPGLLFEEVQSGIAAL